MFGEFQRGREACDAAIAIYEELGLPVSAIGVASERERVERLAGDLDAAEGVLRDASKRLREIGDLGYLSWIDSTLARALALDGRADEAVATARASRSEMQADHAHGQFVARIAEAIALASEGMYSGAEKIVSEALLIANATDSIEAQAEAHSVLASIQAALGRNESAQARLADAIELFERMGNVVSAARLRELAAAGARDP
jgi:ATP/maltotriose-dependent transcriptional regulator MalT